MLALPPAAFATPSLKENRSNFIAAETVIEVSTEGSDLED